MIEWRLRAFRHWLTMKEPHWPNFSYNPIDYQDIRYYSAPKRKTDGPQSMEEVDKEVLKTFEKLGIPLSEQKRLAGVAAAAISVEMTAVRADAALAAEELCQISAIPGMLWDAVIVNDALY
jgi:Fe-S cluster assembly protein SufB